MDKKNEASGIIKALAYFDIFSFPLQKTEIYKWFFGINNESVSYLNIVDTLDGQNLTNIEKVQPFFVSGSRSKTVQNRETNYRVSATKMRRACRVSYLLSIIPWIEGIAVCNSLGYQNAREESDIDFFIITQSSTLWLTRFVAVLFMSLLGLRPKEGATANSVCLSFFITKDKLNLETITIEDVDPYLVYWITQMTILFGRGKIWQDFWVANNWIKNYLPNSFGYIPTENWVYYQGRQRRAPIFITRLVNKALEKFQQNRLPENIKSLSGKEGKEVIVSSSMLKFHTNDRRQKYKLDWQNNITKFDLINQ